MIKVLRVPYKMLSAPIPAEPLRKKNAALLLMDFQKFTCSRQDGLGKLAMVRGISPELDEYYSQVEAAVDNGERLLKACREKGVKVIFTYLHAGESGDQVSRQFASSKLPLPKGKLVDEYLARLQPISGEDTLTRGAYSHFVGANLEERLKDSGVDTLVIAGTLFNYTVAMTAREAADRGFNVIVVWDASASESLDWHHVTRTGLVGGLILSRRADEVIEMLEGKRT